MTTTIDTLLAEQIDAAVTRRAAELQRPELVTQRTCEAVIGIPAGDYLRLSRAGAWPTARERRLVVARTADVLAVYALRLERRAAANDADPLDAALARVGGRVAR
jgi:hypothetical protein